MVTVDFKRLGLRNGFKVLDIGSGPGRHTGAAARFPGVTVIGADICYADIQEAKERLRFQERVGECPGAWALCLATVLRLPFGDETFDAVICAEVLEHIGDERRAAGELARVLRPGGALVVSVPRYFPEKICWRLCPSYARTRGGHIRIYRKKTLCTLMEAQALTPQGYHYAHSLHTPYWWLKCLAGPERAQASVPALYHRFLIWDLFHKPALTRFLDRLFNPIMGKSLVYYFRKENGCQFKPR